MNDLFLIHALSHLLALHAFFTAACRDAYKHVDCTTHCLIPDISAHFFPELSYKYLNNNHVAARKSNMASTTDTNSPTNQGIKSLRILCFGDSLTAGYSGYGYFHYPYAAQLRKRLKEDLPDTEATVDVAGLSGDRVIAGQYVRRIKGSCEKAEDAPYDWIIVLGGTNDLGSEERPDNIYEGLSRGMTLLEPQGANVLALSVLEGEHTSGDIFQRRKELNNLIAYHEEDRLYYIDICAAVPWFSMSPKMRETIWDDGLHLTMDGYKKMGDAIATKLLELLRTAKQPLNSGSKQA
ncbi:MAG: hypothetical protein Q9184_001174 [Pyrenodesmia sp. 2 TL-2023]